MTANMGYSSSIFKGQIKKKFKEIAFSKKTFFFLIINYNIITIYPHWNHVHMSFFKTLSKLLTFIYLMTMMYSSFALTSAEKVFVLDTQVKENTMILHFKIAKQHFLYQERIHISPKTTINWPKSESHIDKMGNTYQIYRHELALVIPKPSTKTLTVQYQGCSDKGICYPPQQQTITINHNISLYQKITILLGFLGFGVLLAFSPCVLPMLPVMTQVVIGKENTSKTKMFFLALSYVLGMSFSYGLVGAVLAKIGKNSFVALQTPIAIVLMALVYLYLGLATLELIRIRLPSSLSQHALLWRSKLQSGHYYSAALIGALSLLILSPCITAPTLAAMTYITQLGQAWMGSIALMLLGFGMGIPLMIFTISAGHFLPKAGPWMNKVKIIIALLLFGLSVLLFTRIPQFAYAKYLWLVWFLVSCYLLKPQSYQRVYYITCIIMGIGLGVFIIQNQKTHHHLKTMTRLNDIQTKLSQSERPSLVYFSAKWCASCQYIEKNILAKQELAPLLAHYQMIKVDLTEHNAEQERLMQRFHVIAPPTIIRLNPTESARLSGEEITLSHLLDLVKKQSQP